MLLYYPWIRNAALHKSLEAKVVFGLSYLNAVCNIAWTVDLVARVPNQSASSTPRALFAWQFFFPFRTLLVVILKFMNHLI